MDTKRLAPYVCHIRKVNPANRLNTKKRCAQLLQVVEAGGKRMIKLRNPHAGNEWSGPFSDADGAWEEYPEVAAACGHEVSAIV